MFYQLRRWKCSRTLKVLRKFLQRSHSVSPHLKQPGVGVIIVGREPFLLIEGAINFLRFLVCGPGGGRDSIY